MAHGALRRALQQLTSRLLILLFPPFILSCGEPVEPVSDSCNPTSSGTWVHLGLEGQWITSLAETPWGIFAGTGHRGVYRCNPANGRWEPLGLDHAKVSAMLMVPGPTPRLLVGMRNRAEERTAAAVFATEDGGRTWLPWDGGLADRNDNRQWAVSLAIDPGDPDNLYLGQEASILRSSDGGRTWRYTLGAPDHNGGGMDAIVVSPARDGRIWAAGTGATFAGFVMFSDDWGETWGGVNVTPRVENSVFALAVDPRDPRRLWAGVGGGVMRSEDYGRTWNYALLNGGAEGSIMMSILVAGEHLYAVGGLLRPIPDLGNDLALYRSADRGTTWEQITAPPGIPGSDVAILDSSGRLLIGTTTVPGGGLWRYKP